MAMLNNQRVEISQNRHKHHKHDNKQLFITPVFETKWASVKPDVFFQTSLKTDQARRTLDDLAGIDASAFQPWRQGFCQRDFTSHQWI
jgi:hypothetical protein